MNRRWVVSLVLGWILAPFASSGDMVFDVTFENPPHTNGSAPTVGIGSDRPTGLSGTWTVANNFLGSSSQAAVMSALASGGGLGFSPGSDYSSGVHTFSWDLGMIAPSSQSSVQILGLNGPSQALIIDYFGDSTVRIYDPLNGSIDATTASLGLFHAFSVTLDLDSLQYGVSVDGSSILASRPLQSGTDVYSASILNPFGSTAVGVDNFRWDIIPEPSTLALLAIAGLGFALRARRSRRPAH